jgi:ornithine--oxo-acid transaminase
MTTQQYIELEERYGAHNYHPLDIVITRGEGVWLTDVEGKRYLDCLASYSASTRDIAIRRSCRLSRNKLRN